MVRVRWQREGLERLHDPFADASRRYVHDAPKTHIVVRVQDQPEIGECVLDLFSFVEPDTTDDSVSSAGSSKRVFERARLRIGAIQDGDGVLGVLVKGRPRGPCHELGFVQVVAGAIVEDLRPTLTVCVEPFLLAVAIVRDDGGGRVEDDLRRAIVPLQPHGCDLWKVVFEVQNVPEIGPAPLVDGLVRIADHAQVVVGGEVADEEVLRAIGVLVLVHHHVAELSGVALAHGGGLVEELDGLQQQVIEIESVGFLQRPGIRLEQLAHQFVARRPGARNPVSDLHSILCVADPGEHDPRLKCSVDAGFAQDVLHQRQLVARVVDDEVSGKSYLWGFAAKQPGAQRMERGDPHAAAIRAQKSLDARAHFSGRLVRERDGQNAVGLRKPVTDEVRNAMRNDASLARASARQDEKRALGLEDGIPLFGIET